MSETELLIRLRDLHEQLSAINVDLESTDFISDETVEALGQLVTDANGLVDQVDAVEDVAEVQAEHQDLVDRIKGFESHHPRVMSFLSQMTDFLAMIGI